MSERDSDLPPDVDAPKDVEKQPAQSKEAKTIVYAQKLDAGELEARQTFLRRIYSIVCIQWTALVVYVWAITYWHSFRVWHELHLRGLEFWLLLPALGVTIVALMIYHADSNVNWYLFLAFSVCFVVTIGTACVYRYDDRLLLLAFMIVDIYALAFLWCHSPTLWPYNEVTERSERPPLSFLVAMGVSAGVTAFVTFWVGLVLHWMHIVIPACAIGGAIIGFGMLDTYLVAKHISHDDTIQGVISLYIDPFRLIVSVFAYFLRPMAEAAGFGKGSVGPSTASEAFD